MCFDRVTMLHLFKLSAPGKGYQTYTHAFMFHRGSTQLISFETNMCIDECMNMCSECYHPLLEICNPAASFETYIKIRRLAS